MRKTYFLLSAVLFSVTGSFAQTTTTTLNYTGAMQTFVVPACIYSIHADMSGAEGGGNASVSAEGGKGGRLETDIPVTPGQTLYIFVGGMGDATGTPGYNGGGSGFGGSVSNPGSGGGGATDIRIGGTTLNDRVAVAGGGGGGTENGGPATGGAGGGLIGGGPSPAANPWACTPLVEPTGGTQSAGGTGGTSTTCAWNGFDGSFGLGGDSYNNYRSAGGGGGWYGGGGGHNGCGGAGGSSYAYPSATNVVHTQGYHNGNGIVILTYAPGPPMPGPITGSATICENTSATYSISAVPAASSYVWNVPAGTVINSGQGTLSINVTAGSTSGNITVYGMDPICGSGPAQTLAVTINPISNAGTASSNSSGACVGDSSTSFSVTGETGSVAWELSADGGMTWQNFGSGNPFMPGAPSVSDTGTILVHAVVTSGVCSSATSNDIAFVVYPPSNAGTPSVSADTVCEGSSIMLSSAGTSSGTLMWYSYNGSNYTYLGNGNPYMVNNLSAGNNWYVAMLTSGTCTTDTSAMIGVYADSAAIAGTITSTATSGNLCVNDSVTFMTNGSFGAIEWMVLDTNLNQWVNFGYGNPLYPGAPSASDVGMYTFITVATHGVCPADTSMSYVINVHPLPAVDLGADTTVCGGITLDAGNPGSIYLWNTTQNAQTIAAGNTGTYSVIVTTSYGCSSSDTIALVVNPLPDIASTTISQNVFCIDDAIAPLTGGSPAGGVWSGNGIIGGNSFSPSTAGLGNSFIVYTYTDSIGCSDSIGATILVNACTGITENQLEGNVSVFPNPNNGTFTLLVNADENEMLVELIDVAGKTVYSSSEKDVHAGYRQEINLESVAGGIYMLRITANGEQSLVRIAVQK
jgi:hypothetical protein